jgi:ankyrin repeat protein
MYAAKYNKVEILKLLVKHGADLRKRSDKGFTAKRYAQLSNAKEALDFLEGAES